MELTLENSIALLQEIERRIKADGKWIPGPTHEEIEAQRKASFDERAKAGHLLPDEKFVPLPAPPTRGLSLDYLGWASGGSTVAFMQHVAARRELDDRREAEMSEARESACSSLRADLRIGRMIAATREPHGFSEVVPAKVWDGTGADSWFESGKKDGQEIHVAEVAVAQVSKYRDGGEKAAVDWLKTNYSNRIDKDKSKAACFAAAQVDIPSLEKEAFKRAWAAVSEDHPDWGMSKPGRR